MQLALFAPASREPVTLVHDETGEITYTPSALEPDFADRLFVKLQAESAWTSERRPMYDRVVDVPRLTARLDLEVVGSDPDLHALSDAVTAAAGAAFNSVWLNLYRDEHDSVAWHNDHEDELVPNPVIALVSLGATREMRIRSKTTPRKTLRLDLEPGSLLVMRGATQRHWEHHVPKERRPSGPRISVAFRQRKA